MTNTGDREGADVPQVYLTGAPDERRCRLLGFERLELDPGESRAVSVTADPRLLARFDGRAGRWRIAGGAHQVAVGKEAGAWEMTGETQLEERSFGS